MQSIEFVRMEFVDLNGGLKGFEVPAEKYRENEFVSLDGSSIPGFTSIESSDLYLKPSQGTFREDTDTAFVFCDLFTPEKQRFSGDPRFILSRAIEKSGFDFVVGAEPEFYLFNEKSPRDEGCYFDISKPMNKSIMMKREIVGRLKKAGLDVELKHHEVGPGQYEINFGADDALKTAENILVFKRIIRETACEKGSIASFLPKPFQGKAGNGMHLHLSLWEGSKNVFDCEDGLSEYAEMFVAGLLEHAREITAITNPTVNSYKRLVPGFEVPVNVCWGFGNRSTLIRVPAAEKEKTRLEYRSPDPSANPFLALSVVIAAGMDGIENELIPPEPVEKNVYEAEGFEVLPGDLREALCVMRKSSLVKRTLGEHAFREFVRIKEREWSEYSAYVSGWERQRYLTV